MSRRSDDKPKLQFLFVREWVAGVNAGALLKRGLSLVSSELTRLHCFGSSADDLFHFLADQQRMELQWFNPGATKETTLAGQECFQEFSC